MSWLETATGVQWGVEQPEALTWQRCSWNFPLPPGCGPGISGTGLSAVWPSSRHLLSTHSLRIGVWGKKVGLLTSATVTQGAPLWNPGHRWIRHNSPQGTHIWEEKTDTEIMAPERVRSDWRNLKRRPGQGDKGHLLTGANTGLLKDWLLG